MTEKEQYLRDSTLIFSANVTFIQELYQKYLNDKNSVDKEWQEYFINIGDELADISEDFSGASWSKDELAVIGAKNIELETDKKATKKIAQDPALKEADLEYKVARLINRFRRYGHYSANLDPLKLKQPEAKEVLTKNFHNISDSDLKTTLNLRFEPDFAGLTVEKIIAKLQKTYSSTLAFEFEYISNIEEKLWLRNKVENSNNGLNIVTKADQHNALNHLHRAKSFEQLLHKKFPGAKRFSVEGGEAIMPALEKIIDLSGKAKINDLELGMAHRGRLNVLTNICGKPYDQMIAEFKGASSIPAEYNASGDVKYHMGYSMDREFGEHKLHVALAYNPSHLEAVNSVVAGKVRAKQDLENDLARKNTLSVLIHGDAAFMGQGTVAECLNMAYVDAYDIGGTIHFIINNQVGFTANNQDSRSTRYSSDLAKFIEAPIIHVNGEDIEAVIYACILAFDYRQKFGKDVVLDIVCYRKYGHNEGDEPNYTQPIMYNIIKNMQSIDEKYAAKLISEKVITAAEYEKLKTDRSKILEQAFINSDKFSATKAHAFSDKWAGLTTKERSIQDAPKTGLSKTKLSKTLNHLLSEPQEFNMHPKIAKQYDAKKKIFAKGTNIDWALGESLAYASLLEEGYPVRLTGQDAKRGTFSHRHSVLRDTKTEKEYIPLNNLSEKQATYLAADSVLSEYAVLGFEYGYSLSNPHTLTIWEAQFGDFANGCQIMFDQFIASGETKWLRLSGLVMLLPHGYEGQGPEHSSARLERYLQACAEDNIQVANVTTPANFFHILRRQIHRNYRKPLIVMSPKSLLRHKLATSQIEEMDINTEFKTVIAETDKLTAAKNVKKLVLCTGKIYYDLYEAREKAKINNVALIRVEELYPYPDQEIIKQLQKYVDAEVIWCQEEPENMGAWQFIDRKLEGSIVKAEIKAKRPIYVGRKASASPATGYMKVHVVEQEEIIAKALK
ncbi:MAG: 2-oxoglutarate dehydrogenase E1 component [Alphaproteobacteria bacterium]|jgi:2-oxoglutarate dehydrogenase E1 component|nr:2-oxoglutarate dehydrogenase E1 component [Alphaproteobacteria bacterium]